jgi:hypothetical protein
MKQGIFFIDKMKTKLDFGVLTSQIHEKRGPTGPNCKMSCQALILLSLNSILLIFYYNINMDKKSGHNLN